MGANSVGANSPLAETGINLYVRRGTKPNAHHGRLRATRESMGNIPSQRSGWGDVAQTRYSGILTRLSKHILSFPDELNIVFSGNMCPSDFS